MDHEETTGVNFRPVPHGHYQTQNHALQSYWTHFETK